MKNKIRVGVIEKDTCIIGWLDEKNIPPSAPHLRLVYIDYFNGGFIVAQESELIFI